MAVTLVGQEGYFTREGKWIGEYNRVAAVYGSDLTNGFLGIWGQYASSDQAAVQNYPNAVDAYRNTGLTYQSTLQGDAQLSSLLQVARDTSVVPYSVIQSVIILRSQMVTTADSINRPTLGGTSTPDGDNIGNAVVAVSTTNIYGDPLDMTFNETFTCTATQSGTTFQGSLACVGELAISPNLHTWPGGSGANATASIVDPAVDGLITDGGFASWSGTGSNTPDDWDIINGDAGVTVFKSAAGGVRAGTDAAQITSDGAQATQLAQDVSLSPNTVYALTFQAKINTATATGTFRIALTDGDGTVLTDDAGAALSYTRNLNGQIGTAYAQFTVFFSTPRQLPSTVRLYIGTSVAATAARVITFDLVGIVAATPLYGMQNSGTSGPFVACFAGSTASATGDFYEATFTNSLGTKSFVWGMERIFGLRNNGIYLPSSGSPTIADSLVTY